MATLETQRWAEAAADAVVRWVFKLTAAYILGCLFGILLVAIGFAILVATVEL